MEQWDVLTACARKKANILSSVRRKTVAIILQIIMEGVIGSSYQSDIAVDDIYLSKGTCCQLKHRAFDIASVGELKFVYAE